jgi:excisionase family DNA binding protein
MEKLYTLPEIAEILKVSRKSVYRYIESGKLKASKGTGQWRIKQSNLDTLLK